MSTSSSSSLEFADNETSTPVLTATSLIYDKQNDVNDAYDNANLFLTGWPHFHSYGTVHWLVDFLIVVAGVVGNVLQFILMSDVKVHSLSYSVYLRFLAVSDSLVLVAVILRESEHVFDVPVVVDGSDAVCKLLNSFGFLTKLLSPWLVVGLTQDRYVVVCCPLSRDRLCTRTRAAAVCFFALLSSIVIVSPFLFELRLQNGVCGGSRDLQYFVIFIRLLLSSSLPCATIFVLSVLSVVHIKRGNQFRSTFMRSRTGSANQKQKDASTRPLVMISVLAFVTLLPVSVAECIDSFYKLTKSDSKARDLGHALWPYWNVIYMLNFAQNFYILIGSSSNYRDIMRSKFGSFRTISNEREQTTREANTTDSGNSGVHRISLSTISASVENL